MGRISVVVVYGVVMVSVMLLNAVEHIDGAISAKTLKAIIRANTKGPYLGITTQLLLSLFNVEGVVHYGIAGNANPDYDIADVVIPQYWSHTALWNWQRYGKGPEDELPLESQGDYTRNIGYLKFANYTVNVTDGSSYDNLLNNIWYQPEEIFPVTGTPEEREHAFWVEVDPTYYEIAQNSRT